MSDSESMKLLFVINPVSGGKEKVNWEVGIKDYFKNAPHQLEIHKLTGKDDKNALKDYISKFQPHKVIAVGGDGTVKMVAEQLIKTEISLGILPAGSANGMAKELEIPGDINKALDIINDSIIGKIDLIRVDGNISMHLSDIGLNALLIKYFDEGTKRGMWGYAKVLFRVFRTKRLMRLEIELNEEKLRRVAYMVVIANAKTYGTGAVINPNGNLFDGKFEVVVVRKLSLSELFKMLISHKAFDEKYIEIIQTTEVTITANKKNHFQTDGEYCGRTNSITAAVIPAALNVLLPRREKK
jgi:YegS/Rv2252/BmrU family lipid kinase